MLYFTPSFGLFSILHHWEKEQIPFASKYRNQVNKTGILYLYKTNITKEQWYEIDRYDYDLETGPSYSEYTVYNLDQYFIFFWIILLVHIFINIVIKLALAKPFRFEKTMYRRRLPNDSLYFSKEHEFKIVEEVLYLLTFIVHVEVVILLQFY